MSNYRSPKLLSHVRTLPCARCGREGRTQASHSNSNSDAKGMGIKAHDYRIAALCVECHVEIDQGSRLSKEERKTQWDEAHRRTIGELFERGLVRPV